MFPDSYTGAAGDDQRTGDWGDDLESHAGDVRVAVSA
jgi:hypothetical protein